MVNKTHMYDATEIFRTLPQHQKEAYFKIGFYLVSFFYYLYRCVHLPFPDDGFLELNLTISRMIVAFIAEVDA